MSEAAGNAATTAPSAASAGAGFSAGASGAGGGLSSGMAGAGSNIYGSMADVGGNASNATSGFSSGLTATNGPMMEGPAATPAMAADIKQYGTAAPSMIDRGMNALDRYQKGGTQSLPEAYKTAAWGNPATYGYVGNKVMGMAGGGGGATGQPASLTTNVSYQQPQNEYLRKRRGY